MPTLARPVLPDRDLVSGRHPAAPRSSPPLGTTMIGPGLDVKKRRRKRADTVQSLAPRPAATEGTTASVQGAAPRTAIDEKEAL